MKIVAGILICLLIAALGGMAYFYQYVHVPQTAELEKLIAGQPELERARKELKRFKERDAQETGWIAPAADALRKDLADEIAAGKAEIAIVGSRIVLNIAESVLFTPLSVTFAKDSQPSLARLAAMLKPLKDREIVIGNATRPAPAQGKGRKMIPAKDARTIAAGRSVELVKYLEKNGVPAEAVIAAAYPTRLPEQGFRLKADKTIIVISPLGVAAPASAAATASAPSATSAAAIPASATSATAGSALKPAPVTQSSITKPAATQPPASPPQGKPAPIPISPAPPKPR